MSTITPWSEHERGDIGVAAVAHVKWMGASKCEG